MGRTVELVYEDHPMKVAELVQGQLVCPATWLAGEPLPGDTVILYKSREVLLVHKRHHYQRGHATGRMRLTCEVVEVLAELPPDPIQSPDTSRGSMAFSSPTVTTKTKRTAVDLAQS